MDLKIRDNSETAENCHCLDRKREEAIGAKNVRALHFGQSKYSTDSSLQAQLRDFVSLPELPRGDLWINEFIQILGSSI